MRGTTKI